MICDQVHMSNKLDDSTIASESEHDFGVQKKMAAPKNMVWSVKHVHNLLLYGAVPYQYGTNMLHKKL